ncbi:MAG: hypothetical protein QOJ29_3043, partial [Thermoleophilaceae bacterium]|nr:hypothetical protein [Thermoleophilaceae bacterium]
MQKLSRFTLSVCCVSVASSVVCASAFAAPRQVGSLTFTATTPNAVTGTVLDVSFQNPDDPAARPYTVANMVIHIPTGTKNDTTAPPQCHATDAELLAFGPAACPADTKIGGGYAVSDTGANSPSRYSRSEITNFNNQDEVIGIAVNNDIPVIRNIDRSKYGPGTLTSTFPIFPAAPEPPTNEPYTPLSHLHIAFPPHKYGDKAYGRTPPTCPLSRHWTF